jgi:hypothetical protein
VQTAARLPPKGALSARTSGTAPANAKSNSGKRTRHFAKSFPKTEKTTTSRMKSTKRHRLHNNNTQNKRKNH